jgi:hypothetical protein
VIEFECLNGTRVEIVGEQTVEASLSKTFGYSTCTCKEVDRV